MKARPRLWWRAGLPFILLAGSVILVAIAVTLVAFFLGWGWKATEYIAVTSLTFAILSFVVSFWVGQRTKEIAKAETARAAIIQALQEEKESIGYAVQTLKRTGLSQYEPSDRKEILESLVLAALFSHSDRALMMTFSVLWDNYAQYPTEIEAIVTSLKKMIEFFEPYKFTQKELDLSSAKLKLGAIRRLLDGPSTTQTKAHP